MQIIYNYHSTAMAGQLEQWKGQPGVTAYQIQNWDESHKALAGVIAKIRQSLDLEDIFNTTVTEVRQLLQTDRVGVLRFDPQAGWQGELIWENVGEQWVRGLDLKVRDHCFGDRFAPLYRQGRISAIRDIYQQGLNDCHVQILEQFQVRANLVAPLVKEEQLWGLLCIHQCQGPRTWKLPEIEFTNQIAQHLGVALQQNELLQQARDRARRQKALTEVIARIRQSLDLETIFANTVTQMRQLLQADRVGVWRFYPELDWEGEFIWEDVGPYWQSVIGQKVRDRCLRENWAAWHQEDRISVTPDIYRATVEPCYRRILEKFQIRANLVAPLWKQDVLWGLLCVHQCQGPRDWDRSDIQFVQQIAAHLTVALQQADYLEQVQAQSAQLAQAKEREKTAKWQKTLAATVDKIRRSLDIDTIFNTTTQEVRELLKVERVTIFRLNSDLNSDRNGEFVAESLLAVWQPAIATQWKIPDMLWPETSAISEGNHQTLTVDDISTTQPLNDLISLPDCLQAKAYIIAPIFQGDQLWGLLGAYQQSTPRHWQGYEVNLLAQIGIQLGIALQQVEYLEQVQAQSAQLAIATEQEKAAQRQKTLVKTVENIRRSLDLDIIFNTTTQEVREILAVEGVAIYRFSGNASGEIVAESGDRGEIFPMSDRAFTADDFWQATPEGKYAGNAIGQVAVVEDISQVGHSKGLVWLESVGPKLILLCLFYKENSSGACWQFIKIPSPVTGKNMKSIC
jgi:GAF domain-containing protein